MLNKTIFLYNFLVLFHVIVAWDADDLSLFDVVEDVNKNFYELLEVDQSASQNEIRRAYRKISLQLHPDKNKDPDAENQFRQLVSVYEVLKDEKLRIKYNEILINGLPDWRQPVYYYRRVRKMGLLELIFLLSIILTVGHFLVMWSMYLERKFELEEIFRSRKKRDKKAKKQKFNEDNNESVILPAEVEHLIIKPKLLDLLPFIFMRNVFYLVKNLPSFFILLIDAIKSSKFFNKTSDDDAMEDDDLEPDEDEIEKAKQKKLRQANQFVYQMAEPTEVLNYNNLATLKENEKATYLTDGDSGNVEKMSEWTESEIEMLVKAIVRFPGGTVDRWDKISTFVGRSVKDVAFMSKKLNPKNQPVMSEMNSKIVIKRNVDHLLQNVELSKTETDDFTTSMETKVKEHSQMDKSKTQENEKIPTEKQQSVSISSTKVQQVWTQQQQKQLENAMVQISKDIPDRWSRIAELVPGKTKDDCLHRVKYLAEVVRRRKVNPTSPNSDGDSTTTLSPT